MKGQSHSVNVQYMEQKCTKSQVATVLYLVSKHEV